MNTDSPTHVVKREDDSKTQLPSADLRQAHPDGVRHRLTPEQRSDIARLYAESTSVSEIRQQYSISEPTVYRILQTQGVSLRGRTTQTAVSRRAQGAGKRVSNGSSLQQSAPTNSPGRRQRTRPSSSGSNRAATRFRIVYLAERVIDAADIRDAMRQAESLGADDIVELSRER